MQQPSHHNEQEAPTEVVIVVAATPVPQPRQRHGAVVRQAPDGTARAMSVNYTDSKHPVRDFKYQVQQKAQAAMQGRDILSGPLHLGVSFVLPRPQGLCRKKDPDGRIPCDRKKGDIDNFIKAVLDALNHLTFHDDSQVCSVYATKDFAARDESPHVLIVLQPLLPGAPHDDREPGAGETNPPRDDS